jgi:YggT family protein
VIAGRVCTSRLGARRCSLRANAGSSLSVCGIEGRSGNGVAAPVPDRRSVLGSARMNPATAAGLPGKRPMATCRRPKETRMLAIIRTIDFALSIYWWLLIASAIFSWLYAFNVVNPRNQAVGMIGNFLFRVTEPALRPIRKLLPDLGGIDISPIILLLIIYFIRQLLWTTIAPLVVT